MRETADKSQKYFSPAIKEAGFYGACIGFLQDYITPYILFIKGSLFDVALANALPNLFAALSQIKSADIAQKIGSRSKTAIIFGILQGASLVGMTLSVIAGIKSSQLFLSLIILFGVSGALVTAPWGSLLSEIIPEDKRGALLGKRAMAAGLATISCGLLSGVILHCFGGKRLYIGFFLIFALSSFCRFWALRYVKKVKEPEWSVCDGDCFTLRQFLGRLRESNYAKFVVFVAVFNFTVNIASPFFSVLLLRELQYGYLGYSIILTSAPLILNLLIPRWGRHADLVGNLRVMKWTAPLIGLIPILWLFNQSLPYLILAQFYSGFLWAGFNIASSNYIYDAVTPPKRVRCIAYFNFINGIALAVSSFLGALLLKRLPPLFGSPIYTLLLISGILRLAIGLLFPPLLKEVRSGQKVSGYDLFSSVIGIRPMLGIERKALRF